MQTQEQMRELDAWICEHAMGFKRVKHPWEVITNTFAVSNDGVIYILEEFNRVKPFHPTTEAAAAMEVLRKCCEKGERGTEVKISLNGNQWRVLNEDDYDQAGRAETLELSIALFARELFSK